MARAERGRFAWGAGMVQTHFGLREGAFRLTPELGVRCDWPAFAEARARIAQGLGEGRRMALLGEAGTGKTLLLRSLAQEFAGAVYLACGPRYSRRDLEQALGGANPAMLLLDEAGGAAPDLVESLAQAGSVAVALAAGPGFDAVGFERVALAPMTAEEVAAYVQCRLAAAGWRGGALFEAGALVRIHDLSGGAARRVNNLCSAALFLAAQRKVDRLDADLVAQAAGGLSVQPAPTPAASAPRRRPAPAPVSPATQAPIIVAAFMRERGGAAKPAEPARAAVAPPAAKTPSVEPPPPVEPPAPPAPAPPAPVPAGPPAAPPAAAAPLLAAAAPRPRVLAAPAIERLRPEPPAPQPAVRKAVGGRLWLTGGAAAALVALGVAWRMELAPRPDLDLDWRPIEGVMSPRPASVAILAAAGGATVFDDRSASALSAANEPPVAFPYPLLRHEAALAAHAEDEAEPGADADAAAVVAVQPPADEGPASPQPPEPASPEAVAARAGAAKAEAPASANPEAAAASPGAVAALPPPAAPVAAPPAAEPQPAPALGDAERIAELLARARRLSLAFALTTPPGQSAYDSYREVLGVEPQQAEALAGLDEIAAKYDALAALARQREKPALVQLYETRAAQVRRERSRFAPEASDRATPQR